MVSSTRWLIRCENSDDQQPGDAVAEIELLVGEQAAEQLAAMVGVERVGVPAGRGCDHGQVGR